MLNQALVAQIRDALDAARTVRCYSDTAGEALAADATNALRCLAAMIADEMCNGWSNHETWTVNLWLSNEQGTDEAARELVAGNVLDDGSAAEALKDYCEELCFGDEMAATMGNDLLRSALGAVNWQEIAAVYAGEIEEA